MLYIYVCIYIIYIYIIHIIYIHKNIKILDFSQEWVIKKKIFVLDIFSNSFNVHIYLLLP